MTHLAFYKKNLTLHHIINFTKYYEATYICLLGQYELRLGLKSILVLVGLCGFIPNFKGIVLNSGWNFHNSGTLLFENVF